MTADDIREKTGIESRIYTERDLDELALLAATRALEGAGRRPGGDRRGHLLLLHEHAAAPVGRDLDVRAARHLPDARLLRPGGRLRRLPLRHRRGGEAAPGRPAPGPRGLRGEVLRQDRQRPAVAHDLRRRGGRDGHRPGAGGRGGRRRGLPDLRQRPGEPGQLDHLAQPRVRQRRHGLGPGGEGARGALPRPDDGRAARRCRTPRIPGAALVDAIDLVVPHQANRTMVVDLAGQAGIPEESLYFNIDRVGNVSAASIPIAIHDAVTDGRHRPADEDLRARLRSGRGRRLRGAVDRPGGHRPRGAGAAPYATDGDGGRAQPTTVDDVRQAFG